MEAKFDEHAFFSIDPTNSCTYPGRADVWRVFLGRKSCDQRSLCGKTASLYTKPLSACTGANQL